MQPKVSIVIPVYNVQEYLRECLDSVVGQTLQEIEIVCVNDGSTDGSRAILEEYAAKDPRIVVINKENAGYGAGINDGFRVAKGEYVGIVESDDYILPEMYEELYSTATRHDVDVVKSDFQRFWGDKRRLFEYAPLSKVKELYNVKVCPRRNMELFDLYVLMQPGIYKREFIEKNHIRLNETPGASYQDNGFWFQVFAQANSAYFIPKAYYMLRRDNPNSSINSTGKAYCMCEEYDFIRNFILEKQDQLHPDILKVCAKKRFSNYRFTMERIAPELRKEFSHRFGEDFKCLRDLGELDPDFFTMGQWGEICQVMEDPDGYYYRLWVWYPERNRLQKRNKELEKKITRLEKRIKELEGCNSFKVGRTLTAPARFMKRAMKGDSSKKKVASRANNALATTNNKKALAKTVDSNAVSSSQQALLKNLPSPIVSVIMPVYNSEDHIAETLDTLLAQTLTDIEIICIDDGSTDNSLCILNEYAVKDRRIKVVHQENAGAAAARNAGLDISQGVYVSILDADDLFDTDMLRSAVAELESTCADFVVFRADRFFDDGTTGQILWSLRMANLPSHRPFAPYEIKGNVFKAFVGWAWDKVYRRSFIEEKGLRFQNLRTTNDMYFTFSALVLADKISVLDKVLVHQRRASTGTLSTTREKSWNCFYEALCRIRSMLKDNGLYDQLEQDYVNYCLHACLWNLDTLSEPTKSLLHAQLKNEWFEDLGIAGKPEEYFYDKREWEKYRQL